MKFIIRKTTLKVPKRFTDTEKWKKPFIRSLEAPYKLLWFYILDDCNHAGIWEVDFEVAEIRIGEKLSIVRALEKFAGRVQKISETKWFIPDFISFQYGELNEKNRLHFSVINILSKYGIKGVRSPLQGAKEQDKDKDKDKDKGGVGEIFLIEDCLRIALHDPRWVKANKTNQTEVENFNHYLEKQGKYSMNPQDYKTYFAKLKGKYPDAIKKELSMEDLRKIAAKMDKEAA